ncbi:MAG: methylated-DNA--[protein]-cysteine S-methyltransferase [Anaerolineae bacterium]|nr:MAG: methylated-DNA--[protein]-cysteine S-methyltransferase [Anaerolineae bacterium]
MRKTDSEDSIDIPATLDELLQRGPTEASATRALNHLNQRLAAELPPLVHYAILPNTRIGDVWVAASSVGLVLIDFDLTEDQVIANIHGAGRFRIQHNARHIDQYLQAVKAYLQGKTAQLDLPVDLRAISPFQRSVLMAAREVPRGQVSTYAEIARRIGKPRAFRAVGQALRHNPVPVVIPCHRVVNSDGTLGGYAGVLGSKRKVELLKLEGVMIG